MTKKENKELIADICNALEKYADNNAFVIDDKAYTYSQLKQNIYGIATNSFASKVTLLIS